MHVLHWGEGWCRWLVFVHPPPLDCHFHFLCCSSFHWFNARYMTLDLPAHAFKYHSGMIGVSIEPWSGSSVSAAWDDDSCFLPFDRLLHRRGVLLIQIETCFQRANGPGVLCVYPILKWPGIWWKTSGNRLEWGVVGGKSPVILTCSWCTSVSIYSICFCHL